MIATELLLAFATAAFAVILIPGPTVLLVTGYALSRGFKIALLSILGVCLGDAVAMMVTSSGSAPSWRPPPSCSPPSSGLAPPI